MEERVRKGALQLSEDTRLFIGSKIERINYIPTPLEFYRDYLSQSKPVILTQLASDWAALNKWDLAYLKLKIGAKPVSIAITPDGLADAVVDGAFQLPEEVKMPFDQFVTKMEQRLEHEIYYLQKQNNCLREEYEELSEDCPGEIDFVSAALNSKPDAINLWVGESRSMSSLHRDPYENIYTVISGQKRFLLYPPTDRVHMAYKRVEVVRLKQNQTSKDWSRLPEPGLTHVEWITKLPDHIEPYEVVLNVGETLYLPAGWFHQVYQSDATIAVNYWYDRVYDQSYTKEQFLNALF